MAWVRLRLSYLPNCCLFSLVFYFYLNPPMLIFLLAIKTHGEGPRSEHAPKQQRDLPHQCQVHFSKGCPRNAHVP